MESEKEMRKRRMLSSLNHYYLHDTANLSSERDQVAQDVHRYAREGELFAPLEYLSLSLSPRPRSRASCQGTTRC